MRASSNCLDLSTTTRPRSVVTSTAFPCIAPNDVAETVERLGVSDILLALPSASRQRRHQIIEGLRSLPVHIRTLPGMADLASGRVSISDFRELDLEDLLGRDPVPPNSALLARDLAGKVVLVTGAGGSIGSELCRQILAEHPAKLLLVEHNEFGLYSIHQELEATRSGAVSRAGRPVAGTRALAWQRARLPAHVGHLSRVSTGHRLSRSGLQACADGRAQSLRGCRQQRAWVR